jgi:hypothetical protein
VVKACQDHFRKLATFSLQDKIDLPYHNMVEEDTEMRSVFNYGLDDFTYNWKYCYTSII